MVEIKSRKMRYNKVAGIIAFVFLFLISSKIQAQYTSSPYSMFGIGEVESRTYGINSGMAGTGIGLESHNFMNTSNPAALYIDTLTFIFDISSAAKISHYSYGSKKDNATSMNLKKFAIGFRLFPKWAVSIGLRPYSNVGYKLRTTSPVEGTGHTYETDFEGSGGLSRLYWTNSFRITDNLSVGANASLLLGTIDRTETQLGMTPGTEGEFSIENSSSIQKGYFDFGAQYTISPNPTTRYTLGVIYGYKTDIKFKNMVKVSSISTGNLLEESTTKSLTTSIPQYVGAGASIISNRGSSSITIAADYIYENWGAIKNPSTSVRYTNSHKFSIGTQYLPNFRLPRNYFQRIIYQAGASYNLSSLLINGEQAKEYAISMGLNLPLKLSRTISYIHISADFGYRTGKSIMSEKYVMFTVGCSINEIWFFKRFYD